MTAPNDTPKAALDGLLTALRSKPAADPVIVYGDGCALVNDATNPGPGGHAWVAYLPDGSVLEFMRHDSAATNSTQEMKALLSCLEILPPVWPLIYRTDSQLVARGVNDWLAGWKANGWRGSKGAVKNRELWQEIDAALAGRPVTVEWVQGHAGTIGNERADQLADMAARDWSLGEGVVRKAP